MIKKLLSNRGTWIFACLLVMGIAFLVDSMKDSTAMAKGITDFNTMTRADFIEGRFVQGTIYDLLDEFAYEEEYQSTFGVKHGERVSAHYYIMPLQATYDQETPQFVAVCIGNTQVAAQAQQLIDEYWSYLETDEEPAVWTEIPITGKIEKLDGEIEQFFYEYFTDIDDSITRADVEPMICPYVIRYHVLSAASSGIGIAVVMMIIGIVGIAGMVIYYMKKDRDEAAAFAGNSFGSSSAAFPESGYNAGTVSSGGYNPVGSAANAADASNTGSDSFKPAGNGAMEELPLPDVPQNQTMDMDSIDTSGLGIGIGDDD